MTEYATLRIYTNEKAKYEGKELAAAVVSYIHSLKIAARCAVLRGTEGCYENGSMVTQRIVELSYTMPLIIDILLPAGEADSVLERLTAMVTDGIVSVSKTEVVSFRSPRSMLPPHLLVRDVMTSKPIFAHTDLSIRAAVELMMDYQLKSLPVVDKDHRVAGIVTQSDLVRRSGMPARLGLFAAVPEDALERWLAEAEDTRLDAIMTEKPEVVREDHRAAEALHLMVRKNLKRLPVVDAQFSLQGMVSRIDMLRALSASVSPAHAAMVEPAERAPIHTARDIAARDIAAFSPDLTLKGAIDKLNELGSQRVAVTDRQGKLVGLVTDSMLLKALDTVGSLFHPIKKIRRRGGSDLTIDKIMERNVVSVGEDTPIEEVLRLFVERGFKRIPVVDQDGTFKGMIRRDSVLADLSHRV